MKAYPLGVLRNLITSDIHVLDNHYQTLYLESRYHFRSLVALIITSGVLKYWFEMSLSQIIFILLLIPILLLLYTGLHYFQTGIRIKIKDIPNLEKDINELEMESPYLRFDLLKEGVLGLICLSIISANLIINDFKIVENICFAFYIILFLSLAKSMLQIRFTIRKKKRFFPDTKSLENRHISDITLNYRYIGVFLVSISYMLFILFLINYYSYDFNFYETTTFVVLLIVLSYHLFQGTDKYFRIKDHLFYLEKLYELRNKTLTNNPKLTRLNKTYKIIRKNISNLKLRI